MQFLDVPSQDKKDSVLTGLLNSTTKAKPSSSSLIQEVEKLDADSVNSNEKGTPQHQTNILPANEDGPSLLELMMQAQTEARKEKETEKQELQKKESKKSFGGFKKGFFGQGKEEAKAKSKPKDDAIPVLKPKVVDKKEAHVLDEVQKAMQEEENRKASFLKTNEWMTGDLVTQFQTNKILSNGFKNPKCMDAMTLMQSKPQEAVLKYQSDKEVSAFLQEFGKVMGEHFTKLGNQHTEQSKEEKAKPIEEIGPLQAKVLKEAKNKIDAPNADLSEDEKVKKILEDEELKTLLMDPSLQRILLECSDPRKLQQNMQDPEISRKIRKLQQAGLVRIEL